VLAAYFLLMLWITPTRYLPVVSSAIGTFAAFRMLPTVVSSLVRPFGKPFKVTPKGSGNVESVFDAYTFTWIAGFIVVTALGLVINIVPETARIQGGFSVIAALWAGINIVVLVIASLICFEKPRRLFQAFKVDEAASVDGSTGRLVSLSLEKAVVAVTTETLFQSTRVRLALDGFEPIQAELRQVTQRRGDISRPGDTRRYYLHLHFDLHGSERDKMIVKLYTGRYSPDIPDIDKVAVSVNLLLRAFGRARTA
jgi:cellulose synthase (UDP-forming)